MYIGKYKIYKQNILIAAIITIIILFIILVLKSISNKTLTCTINNDLMDGFNNEEKIIIKYKNNKINNIKYDRVININEYYQEFNTYPDSLETVLKRGYKYIDNFKVSKESDKVSYGIDLNDSGIVLNNLSITNNNTSNNTSLRYDINSDLSSDNAINIGDKIKKSTLKNKIIKLGYTCK